MSRMIGAVPPAWSAVRARTIGAARRFVPSGNSDPSGSLRRFPRPVPPTWYPTVRGTPSGGRPILPDSFPAADTFLAGLPAGTPPRTLRRKVAEGWRCPRRRCAVSTAGTGCRRVRDLVTRWANPKGMARPAAIGGRGGFTRRMRMVPPMRDMSPVVDLTREPGTGPVRARRPMYVSLLPPCNHACPAGEDIQAWLGLAQAGKFRAAWGALIRDNPLPAVHGRVCYHPCESSCNRKELDTAVSIHAIERFLGDLAVREGWKFPVGLPTHKRMLVIGAGPCGVSAAYHLARLGHSVEIRDAGPVAGGMLHFGIPAYRLPREDLAGEIRRIEEMGVTFVPNHAVRDVLAEKDEGHFDAVLIAIGTQLDKRIDIPAQDASRVMTALRVLRGIGESASPQ